MYIERVQVEEGFLDGLDVTLVPGLNVVIGARGTGKTSLIELIKYCLDVKRYGAETGKRSFDHALSVLGTGQVTVTISDANRKVIVTRTASDPAPRASAAYVAPIIFSQTEIETVGLQAGGRLSLLDSFIGDQLRNNVTEAETASEVRSITAEAETLRREIEELTRQLSEIITLDQQLLEIAPSEQQLTKLSQEAASKKKTLDALSTTIASASVTAAAVERFKQSVIRWRSSLISAAASAPAKESWPENKGKDPLAAARTRVERAQGLLRSALDELSHAEVEATSLASSTANSKITLEEQARQLRKEIEAMQAGAGATVRRGHELRERKAQLESLRTVLNERAQNLDTLLKRRGLALDRLDTIREGRFKARASAAERLNAALGPRIRIIVSRSGQFEAFSAVIANILRGSGMRYGNLSPALAEHVSPRELLEAADNNDFELISDATGISKDRAARTLAQLRESDLGALATVPVEDAVAFQLLDGPDYKDISELSTGQRCTVVLPLVLRHTQKILIVDQPEDHIDNAFITDTLIRAVLARDPTSQIIFSTHNANIPVLGNADRVLQLGSDGRRGFAVAAATLETPVVVSAITTVMEGGAEAFQRRASFYSRHKKQ